MIRKIKIPYVEMDVLVYPVFKYSKELGTIEIHHTDSDIEVKEKLSSIGITTVEEAFPVSLGFEIQKAGLEVDLSKIKEFKDGDLIPAMQALCDRLNAVFK